MADNVKLFPGSTSFNVEQALLSALESHRGEQMQSVLVIAEYPDGDLFIRSSEMNRSSALWLCKKGELHALGILDDDD